MTLCLPEAPADPDAYGLDEPVVIEFCLPCISWIVTLPLLIVACCRDRHLFGKPEQQVQFQSIEYHSVDKRLTYLMMMMLVRHTEEYDMMLHMEKTGMLKLVVEIKVGDMTADDVDKLTCSSDIVKSRQVDLKFAHASI
nr:hypothetical protein [Tanacetum cinerariifolium]